MGSLDNKFPTAFFICQKRLKYVSKVKAHIKDTFVLYEYNIQSHESSLAGSHGNTVGGGRLGHGIDLSGNLTDAFYCDITYIHEEKDHITKKAENNTI